MRKGKEIDFLVLMRAKAREAVLANYPTDTASGSIASFPDGADDVPVKDLTVGIEPVQDLHGYDYPWPAGGGKNLFANPNSTYEQSGITLTPNSDGSTTLSGTADSSAFNYFFDLLTPIPSGTNVTFSFNNTATNSEVSMRLTRRVSGGATTYGTLVSVDAVNKSGTVSESWDATSVNLNVKTNHGDVSEITLKIQAEIGSAATAWTPYSNICPISGRTGLTLSHSGADTSDPEIIAVSWATEAGTVYGGTLDVTTGVLTVTHGQIASYAGETLPGAWISDRDVYAEGTSPSTGAQVVYELAVPVTYQLTPHEVKTLLGDNNFWADTGDVTVEYRADLEKYIEKKTGEGGAGTLSLGALPSMIRPGAGLQSQSLGLDDAEAEYLGELEDDAESYLDDLEDEYNEPKEEAEEELTEEPEEEPEETEASDEAGE